MTENYNEKLAEMKRRFSDMSDLAVREINFSGKKFCVVYISNFCSKEMISKYVLAPLADAIERGASEFPFESLITAASAKPAHSADEAESLLLSGFALVIYEGSDIYALTVGVRNEAGRSGDEPETENVIRGPHEGFTESGESNAMLLRRRLKTAALKKESFNVGTKSSTDVSIMYIKSIADEKVIAEVRKRINAIKIDGIMDSGYIEIYIQDGIAPLFPTVGNSERPDKVAAKLAEGRVAIIVDGSPVVLTVPYLFCEGFQVAEDYSKSPWYASFIRILRLFSFLFALYLPALFIALEVHHRFMMSEEMVSAIESARENLPFSVFWEVIVIFLIFETVREVGLRMPKAVGSAVGLVGSLILGDSAIEAGVASAPVLMVVALAAVCNFIVPPYMHPSILYRFIMIIISGVFGLFGFFIGIFAGCAVVCGKSSFGVPYLAPIAPMSYEGLRDFPAMLPIWSMTKVPSSISGKNITRAKRKEK